MYLPGRGHVNTLTRLSDLADKGDWARARELVAEGLRNAESADDRRLWLLQAALIDFQDDGNVHAQYESCHELMSQLTAGFPRDADIAFWRGYMALIYHRPSIAETELSRCLRLDPQHPYANLVEASSHSNKKDLPSMYAVLGHLLVVATLQPGNRAAIALAEKVSVAWRLSGPKAWAAEQRERYRPFVETTLGAGNRYVNDVLIHATGGGLQ